MINKDDSVEELRKNYARSAVNLTNTLKNKHKIEDTNIMKLFDDITTSARSLAEDLEPKDKKIVIKILDSMKLDPETYDKKLSKILSPTNERGAVPAIIKITPEQLKLDALVEGRKEFEKPKEQTKSRKTSTHRLYRPQFNKLKGGLVKISPGLTWMLKLHARRWKGAESCAMLIGFKDDKAKKFDIRGAVLCSNPTLSAGYFEMPPSEVIKSFNIAEKHGMEIVGVYHSHPSGFEIPSATDERFMEITPGAWIIYSWTGYRCYTLKKGRFGVMNVKEIKIAEERTDEKPIIEYAYDWKTTKFPEKEKPYRWQNYTPVVPIQQVRADPGRVSWPPYWDDMYGQGPYA